MPPVSPSSWNSRLLLSLLSWQGKWVFITSSLGTMKVTEQIDALKVMGINTYNYFIFPKVIAMLFYPFIITISMFLGIFGGYMASIYGGFCTSSEFVEGIQLEFIPYHISYAFVKTSFFSLSLQQFPSYHGYFLKEEHWM